MALLDMCRKEGFQLVVAHMNYKKRDTADRDMELVRSYCARFHIPFEARLTDKPVWATFRRLPEKSAIVCIASFYRSIRRLPYCWHIIWMTIWKPISWQKSAAV